MQARLEEIDEDGGENFLSGRNISVLRKKRIKKRKKF